MSKRRSRKGGIPSSIKTCAYIGSSVDTFPLLQMPSIKNWIFIDSLPKSEGGIQVSRWLNSQMELFDYFMKRLDDHCEFVGYTRAKHYTNQDLIIYKASKGRTLYFFYNTLFPETKNTLLYKMLAKANSIYFAGFVPHMSILKRVKYPLTLLISNNSGMDPCNEKEAFADSVSEFLYKNYVKDISYIYIDGLIQSGDVSEYTEAVKTTRFIPVSNLLEAEYVRLDSHYYKKYLKETYFDEANKIEPYLLESYQEEPKAYNSGKNIPI